MRAFRTTTQGSLSCRAGELRGSSPARRGVERSIGRTVVCAVSVAAASLMASPAPRAEDSRGTLPFGEVRAGMRGYGKTVFAGMKVETFDVEVIGTMTNIAPKRNLILARLTGGPLAQTGILDGMSGSPVYLDGKLAGAVAYSWGFAKESICGVTPIEEMLDLLTREPEKEKSAAASPRRGIPAGLTALAYPERTPAFLRDRLRLAVGAPWPPGLAPARIPLLFGSAGRTGAAGWALAEWEETFRSLGLTPLRAGGAGAESAAQAPLEAGSAVGVQLVRGDVEVAAIGTVTYVRRDEILAFGHPFLSLGPTALPLTRAVVHGVFPSLQQSFKLASALSPIGVVTQDRFAGLAAVTAGAPPVVPVKVTLASGGDRSSTYSFEIVEDPLLTPVFLHLSLLEILASAEKEVGDVTLRVRKGSQIRIEGGLNVQIENLYSGEQSELIASGTVAYMTYLLMNNPDRPSRVEGIELDFEYADARRVARIDRIWCDRYTVAPGETLPLHVAVTPFRGESFTEDIPIEIPEEAPEGRAILQVGDALTLSRLEFEAGGVSFQPTRLEQLVLLLNRIRTNNKIYVTLIRPDTGAFMAGERLPNLPPSIASVLLSHQSEEAGAIRVRLRGLLEADRDTEYAVRGYQKALLEIKR